MAKYPHNPQNRNNWWERRHRKDNEEEGGAPPPPPGTPPALPRASYKPPVPLSRATSALLRYMSPEDAKGYATYYGLKYKQPKIPGEITTGLRENYLSANRGEKALAAIQRMRNKTGTAGGAGYTFLNNAVTVLARFGGKGGQGMSRQQFAQFNKAIDELFDLAKGNQKLAPYAQLASSFLRPSFSAGALYEQTTINGQTIPGAPSKKLY